MDEDEDETVPGARMGYLDVPIVLLQLVGDVLGDLVEAVCTIKMLFVRHANWLVFRRRQRQERERFVVEVFDEIETLTGGDD